MPLNECEMKEAIEEAFKLFYKEKTGRDLEPNDERDALFRAIARGVIKHLAENAKAFDVRVPLDGVEAQGGGHNHGLGPSYEQEVRVSLSGDAEGHVEIHVDRDSDAS